MPVEVGEIKQEPSMSVEGSDMEHISDKSIDQPQDIEEKLPLAEEESNVTKPPSENFELGNDISSRDTLEFDMKEKENFLSSRLIEVEGDDSATESLQTLEEEQEEPHDRSDGSDSGLGSEICEERQEITSTDALECSDSEASFFPRMPIESTIVDRFSEIDADVQEPSDIAQAEKGIPKSTEDMLKVQPKKSNLKRKLPVDDDSGPKIKKKRGISFDSVTVYYFPRAQGFTCVPSQGGSTLGMGAYHTHSKKFTIVEHANEQRRIHRQLMQQMRTKNGTASNAAAATSSEESESEEEPSDASESEMDIDNYYFLQPVPTRQRRALLRAAGVRKIETYEKDDCRVIRMSREFCGCGCKGYCDPETCSCSQAGIKCQVDRLNFPCGCSRDNCANSSGRIEFNPVRVRTHFIHTLMRLELEKKQENEEALKSEKKDSNWMENERINIEYKEEKSKNCRIMKFSNGPDARNELGVESCIHDGSFTNLHYGAPGEGPGGLNPQGFSDLPARSDSLDLYSFREDCYGEDSTQDGSAVDIKHPYSSTTPVSGHGFQFSDTRYSDGVFLAGTSQYSAPHSTNQYSPSPYHPGFTDFNAVFNPYPMYGEFQGDSQKTAEQNFSTPSCSYEQLLPTNEGFSSENSESKENQYTCLNPVVETNNKAESFAELIHGRYNSFSSFNENFVMNGSQDVVENGDGHKVVTENAENTNNTTECAENFGEIIKKSIVETVSA
ncbi:cysteine/serine-rich nuclear protein 3 isoform X2 [Coccinella septempunctata]|nr:cysteine/serine-rich nuclear protein 3 isoform X2 [Coccinella septempunctata]XP_044751131.1 cysteine/serine-rich nuclear protein 3 isoform X2 [Coccinella septempunctata]XP_044751132.1 cysteine/serine-rich nuclear protein 3 isoform X2 [Coccinella septempunctata]